MEKIVSLAKRRGFIFPGSEIYGGLANSWDYGPLGVQLKNNIKKLWWKRFVEQRDDIAGVDTAIIMHPKVWEASGHVTHFYDVMVDCRKCRTRFRVDELPGVVRVGTKELQKISLENAQCPACGAKSWGQIGRMGGMFVTHVGAVEDESSEVYLRPETAQGMFVNFKNVLDTTRKKLPFGIAQIGKAFRNEITPGNFIFRTREFEQMEIEYFVRGDEWERHFEYWREEMLAWCEAIGIDAGKIYEAEMPEGERAHYSKRTIDFEYEFPFGQKELYGLAYRTDFDLRTHEEHSGQNLKYRDPDTNEEFWPHVIEPTWGVDRSVLAVLLEAYDDSDKDRVVLKLKPELAPYKAAVFPLLANKPELVNYARKIYDDLRKHFMTVFDERGNIGKRYYSQDEIGTPWCITVDHQTLEDDTVTLRERDTTAQTRLKTNLLISEINRLLTSPLNRG